MRRVDYDATHMVKAVKGLPLNPNAYTIASIGPRRVKIVDANKDAAIDWFAEWAAQKVNALGPGRKIIVPVPSSKTTVKSDANFRTALIARKIAALSANTLPFPSLRFGPSARTAGRKADRARHPTYIPVFGSSRICPRGASSFSMMSSLAVGTSKPPPGNSKTPAEKPRTPFAAAVLLRHS